MCEVCEGKTEISQLEESLLLNECWNNNEQSALNITQYKWMDAEIPAIRLELANGGYAYYDCNYCPNCGAPLSDKAKKEMEERSAGEIRLKLETFENLMKLAKEMNGLKDDIKLLKSRLEVTP